eukprot:96845-Prymnesium_polylepis.1
MPPSEQHDAGVPRIDGAPDGVDGTDPSRVDVPSPSPALSSGPSRSKLEHGGGGRVSAHPKRASAHTQSGAVCGPMCGVRGAVMCAVCCGAVCRAVCRAVCGVRRASRRRTCSAGCRGIS